MEGMVGAAEVVGGEGRETWLGCKMKKKMKQLLNKILKRVGHFQLRNRLLLEAVFPDAVLPLDISLF